MTPVGATLSIEHKSRNSNGTMAMNNLMLAQLMKDMQDPEMMREAKKMMQDPAFQAHCKKLMEGPQFQQAIAKVKTDLQDPEKVKALEEQTKKAIEKGQEELEQIHKEKAAATITVGKEETHLLDDIPDIPSLNLN